ncbi:MAG: dockerin type I repeat-containing protein [Planctomycetota bacterium]|nr:dockerin type I repeat-containing protein [Planctomycetota bacterium]
MPSGTRKWKNPPLCGLVVVLSLVCGALDVLGQPCPCTQLRPFGSCVDAEISLANPYPGEFPGPAAVVAGADFMILVADLLGGVTYRYTSMLPFEIPTVLRSPRGARPTGGLAYRPEPPGGGPVEARLFWAIDERIVVTHLPAVGDTEFSDVLTDGAPTELDVDLAGLAASLLGSPELAGRLGDLTYHPGRDTLWAVDIVNDIYFELTLDGQLSLDGSDTPIHFFSPALNAQNDKAFGNSITYAATPDGGEFFDILVGSLADGRPVEVVRLLAPTVPGAGNELGMESGVRYPLFDGLLADTPPGGSFPMSLAYWPRSCNETQSSELITVFSPQTPNLYQISADPPQVRNVGHLQCASQGEIAIHLTWRNTGGYEILEVFRRDLDGDDPETMVLSTTGDADPQELLDATLPLPVDGAYRYRFVASSGGEDAREATCTATIGRGDLLETIPLPTPTPAAMTTSPEHVYIVDAASGVASRFLIPGLEADGAVEGPFADGETFGVSYVPADPELPGDFPRLFWLGMIVRTTFLQSTALDGTAHGVLRPLQSPVGLPLPTAAGDLAYDEANDRLWVTDPANRVIFAVNRNGLVASQDIIDVGAVLGGGIAVRSATANQVTLAVVTGPADSDVADRIVQTSYDLPTLGNPQTEYTLHVGDLTRSGDLGGTGVIERPAAEGTEEVQLLVGFDTRRLYVLRLSQAVPGDTPFVRGDANDDGDVNISDASFTLSFLFRGGAEPPCPNAADVDDNGTVNISDPIALFNYLFRGGPMPAAPSPRCGFDATPVKALECEDSICVPDI